jgi:hypothetical protein
LFRLDFRFEDDALLEAVFESAGNSAEDLCDGKCMQRRHSGAIQTLVQTWSEAASRVCGGSEAPMQPAPVKAVPVVRLLFVLIF